MSVTKYTFPPLFNTVKDFDLYETCEYRVPQFRTLPFRKQLQTTQTKQSDFHESFTIMEFQKEKMTKQRVQTSFHNKIFDQHIQCVEKNLIQFVEKSFPHFKTLPKQTLLCRIYGEDPDCTQSIEKLNQLLKKDNKYFDEKHRNQFLTMLFYEESLYDFLYHVCNSIHSQLALQVVFISSLFCQVHAKKQQTNLRQDEIEILVDEALESDHFSEVLSKLEFLTLKRSRMPVEISHEQLEQSIKNLIRVLGNTIILVMEQYFMNRFSKQEQSSQIVRSSFNFVDISNDEYSDDENDFHFCVGNKKRKA